MSDIQAYRRYKAEVERRFRPYRPHRNPDIARLMELALTWREAQIRADQDKRNRLFADRAARLARQYDRLASELGVDPLK